MKHIHQQIKSWTEDRPETEEHRFAMHWMIKGLEQGLEKHNMHVPKIDPLTIESLYSAAVAVHQHFHYLKPNLKVVTRDGQPVEDLTA